MVTDDTGRAQSCGCVQFEEPRTGSIFRTAVNLDERLEVAEAEVMRLRKLVRDLGQDEGGTIERLTEENIVLREVVNAIIQSPMCSREEVQSRLLNLITRL